LLTFAMATWYRARKTMQWRVSATTRGTRTR